MTVLVPTLINGYQHVLSHLTWDKLNWYENIDPYLAAHSSYCCRKSCLNILDDYEPVIQCPLLQDAHLKEVTKYWHSRGTRWALGRLAANVEKTPTTIYNDCYQYGI